MTDHEKMLLAVLKPGALRQAAILLRAQNMDRPADALEKIAAEQDAAMSAVSE